MSLLPVTEAQTLLFSLAPRVASEILPLAATARRWLAEDVIAARTQPAADLSAMDGYAVRFADLPGPLRVIGESAAGHPFGGAVAPGEAVRIFTGAVMPPGTDTVMVQEEAAREGDRVRLTGEGPRHAGRNVRPRGLDFTQGDVLIARGERLTPARVALAAAAGHGELAVNRPIRVALAASGDELVRPGEPVGAGQLPESNGVMLSALLAPLPVDLIDLGILPDDLAAMTASFAQVRADILVTSGGASIGDHDLVRPALEAAGATIDFWRIAMRPGKPMMAGRLGEAVVLGLPGNPVSAFVTATLFLKPLIAAMAGARNPLPPLLTATLGAQLPANDHREDYLRAETRDGRIHSATHQDSSMLQTLARADCLIRRAPGAPAAAAGDSVEILTIA
ncbi:MULTISPECIES: molybdopterin molybdotransferase MoeA [Sphingomonas]|uniref:molybdopterin molybdotransferase MoeA n=1 Tax=Sphingomonas TaxID=13687 RepID=UPI000829594A|nr:gephyrin-like molybdotransferase Glp [Sphingomonas sp. CCH10-B3]